MYNKIKQHVKCDIFTQYNTRKYTRKRFRKNEKYAWYILLCVSSLQKSLFDASAFSSGKIKLRFDE